MECVVTSVVEKRLGALQSPTFAGRLGACRAGELSFVFGVSANTTRAARAGIGPSAERGGGASSQVGSGRTSTICFMTMVEVSFCTPGSLVSCPS